MLIFVPIGASAARYFWIGDGRGNWQTADRSSAGLLPPPVAHPEALIRVFAARTVRWRSIFAVHTWIVVKERWIRVEYLGRQVGPDGWTIGLCRQQAAYE